MVLSAAAELATSWISPSALVFFDRVIVPFSSWMPLSSVFILKAPLISGGSCSTAAFAQIGSAGFHGTCSTTIMSAINSAVIRFAALSTNCFFSSVIPFILCFIRFSINVFLTRDIKNF